MGEGRNAHIKATVRPPYCSSCMPEPGQKHLCGGGTRMNECLCLNSALWELLWMQHKFCQCLILSVMVCTLDKHLHKSFHVNSCQLLVKAMSACRFQADSVIFLHDEQPHAEYLPTKVPALPPTPSLLCCTISTPCNFMNPLHLCTTAPLTSTAGLVCSMLTIVTMSLIGMQ